MIGVANALKMDCPKAGGFRFGLPFNTVQRRFHRFGMRSTVRSSAVSLCQNMTLLHWNALALLISVVDTWWLVPLSKTNAKLTMDMGVRKGEPLLGKTLSWRLWTFARKRVPTAWLTLEAEQNT